MDDLSEKEQLDEIRRWWSDYGSFVIGGIVIGVGLIAGYNYYNSSKLESQLAASDLYEALTVEVGDGDLEEAETIVADITTNYGDTVYAGQAGLAIARLYMDRNRDQDAADALLDVVESDADAGVKSVARLRLARIYLYQEQPEAAVKLLVAEDNEAFSAAYGEVLGDAYAQLGQYADAEAAYQEVLANPLAQGTVDLSLVQWKLLDLPEIVTAEATTDEAATAEVVEAAPDDVVADEAAVVEGTE